MKVKEITKQQYLDLGELGMPTWSYSKRDCITDADLLSCLTDNGNGGRQEDERIRFRKDAEYYTSFVTLVDD